MNSILDLKDSMGFIAAFLTTTAFVPQAYHSWKTRDLSGISFPMYSLFTLGVAAWLIYGLMIDSLPVIVANAITLILSAVVLGLKIKQIKQLDQK
ncbi:MAG: SemiSWEET transporter [Methylophilaceae bacterium]|nr:SemiSWEET transporter [Methylophilaceae bacterium]